VEGPIQVKELVEMTPEIPAVQISPKSDRLSSEAVFGILSSFPRKSMNSKVGDNFVAHNLALFGVRTWEVWCRQARATNQENLDEAKFMETRFPSSQRKISCKAK
jgi:hypothetical protein